MHRCRDLRLAVLLALAAASPAAAQTIAVDPTTYSVHQHNDGLMGGFSFDVLEPVTVTHVAFFDDALDGLAESHDVRIWDAAQMLLASAVVPEGTAAPLLGAFRIAALATPLALAPGSDYRIATYFLADPYAYVSATADHPSVSYNGGVFTSVPDAYPSSTGSAGGFFGPSFAVGATVPEPVSLLLLGTGLLGVGGAARRRRWGGGER